MKRCLHVPAGHESRVHGPSGSCMAPATVALRVHPPEHPDSPDALTIHRCDDHWREAKRAFTVSGRLSVTIRRMEATS